MSTYIGGSLAEDLINSYDTFLEVPEELQSPAHLQAFLEWRGYAVAMAPTEADLAAVRVLRDHLREIWNAEALPPAIEALNDLMATIPATPQVVTGDGEQVQLTLRPLPNASLPLQLTLITTQNMVDLLQRYGLPRLRHCDSSPCRDVFVDTSRNRTRRFCDDRCASRYNVAAYRERQSHKEPRKK